MKKISMSVLAAMATTLAAPIALADDAPVAGDDAQVSTDTAAAASNGLRAVRDKKTGNLREPNRNEIKEMEAMEKAARKARGIPEPAETEVVVTRNADGMRSAKLGPEYLMSLQGERSEDGSIKQSHSAEEKSGKTNPEPAVLETAPTE